MSLKSPGMEPVPEETARLAHIVCPAENLCLLMRDELGEVFQDELFASLFPRRGQPAEARLSSRHGDRLAICRGLN